MTRLARSGRRLGVADCVFFPPMRQALDEAGRCARGRLLGIVTLLVAPIFPNPCATHLFDAENHPVVHGWRSGLAADTPGSATQYARMMMRWAQLVARGRFDSHCGGLPSGPTVGAAGRRSTLRPPHPARDRLESTFVVEELFKGDPRVPTVSIEISADVLVYPGSDATRYEMRQALADAVDREMADLVARMESMNPLPDTAVERALVVDMEEKLASLIQAYNALEPKTIAFSNGKGLWELGGVIRCGSPYLLAVSPDDRGKYTLGDEFDGTIWWGEEADRIVESLRDGAGAPLSTEGHAPGPLCIVCRRTRKHADREGRVVESASVRR